MAPTPSPDVLMTRTLPSIGSALLALSAAVPVTAQRTPTFYEDVLPILQENCQACHQASGMNMGGMVAPFSLLTYEDAAPRAARLARAIATGRMPPWSAAASHKGVFENERILEEAEKHTIVAWAEGGAPAGNPRAAPPTPEFVLATAASHGWTLGEPDLILEFAEPYCMSDDDRDVYVNLPVEITAEMVPQDRWISSVEYRNGPAVHHILGGVGGLVPGSEPRAYDA